MVWAFVDDGFAERILLKVRIFDVLPYLFLVGILIFSICTIKSIVNRIETIEANKYLKFYPTVVLITYILNMAHWPLVHTNVLNEDDLGTKILTFLLFLIRQIVLMLVVYTMYLFTHIRHASNFEKTVKNDPLL